MQKNCLYNVFFSADVESLKVDNDSKIKKVIIYGRTGDALAKFHSNIFGVKQVIEHIIELFSSSYER